MSAAVLTHRGPWRDSAPAATAAALAEVNVDPGEWLELEYSDGVELARLGDEDLRITVELVRSEARDQVRAKLRRARR